MSDSILPLLLCLSMLPLLIASQCCLQFQDSKCVKCPPSAYQLNGSCIMKKSNCLQYEGFGCSLCGDNYLVNGSRLCVREGDNIPIIGFLLLNVTEFSTNLMSNLAKAVQNRFSFRLNLIDAAIYNGFESDLLVSSKKQYCYYRLLFRASYSFFEVLISSEPQSDSKKPARTMIRKTKTVDSARSQETQITLSSLQESKKMKIWEYVSNKLRSIDQNKIIGIYKAQPKQTNNKVIEDMYRIVIFNANEGLIQLIYGG